ncbi:substrate-binding domain-containing protein [Streptomyces sp. NPDC056910]|uniref:substrate-binding domain-containing protein n=1 Tax=Streptomyces sp. NPDC056910 TaxID=3345964 RepID=UPI0036B9B4AD
MNRPTARDVAELAGVSRAAVSFVFSGRAQGNLSAGTQTRIRAAADELGYRSASPPAASKGVLLAAAGLGISVPDDLSVGGYDDQVQMAGHLVPALTTIALPHHAVGAAAVDLLLDSVAADEDVDPATQRVLECPVVERASVVAPGRRG